MCFHLPPEVNMNSERKMKEVKREIDAIREGLDDTLAKSMVKLCNSTIETIEMNRASKLKVWKETYEPLCLGADAREDSVEYKQKIVDKYYRLHKALPALETLRDIGMNSSPLHLSLSERKIQQTHWRQIWQERLHWSSWTLKYWLLKKARSKSNWARKSR